MTHFIMIFVLLWCLFQYGTEPAAPMRYACTENSSLSDSKSNNFNQGRIIRFMLQRTFLIVVWSGVEVGRYPEGKGTDKAKMIVQMKDHEYL